MPIGKKITVISASVGAGHDGPAREITRRLRRRGHLVACHDGLSILPGRLGALLRDAYFAQLRLAPASWGALLEASTGRRADTLIQAVLDRLVTRTHELLSEPVDAIVSTYPLVSQLLGRLRDQGTLKVPVISYLTDAAVHPLWLHPGVDVTLCPHTCFAEQVSTSAHAREGSVTPCAPVVDGAFTRASAPGAARAVRAALGIRPNQTMALVTSGSAGTGNVCAAARDLDACGATPVVACGRSTALRRRVERLGVGPTLGWVDDMPHLVAAADVVVQNAGGLACWEALAAGRPVLSYRVLSGHGRANAAVLAAAGVVPWARTRRELGLALAGPPAPVQLPSRPDAAEIIERVALRTDHDAATLRPRGPAAMAVGAR
ncbi:MGDG synthase family glycosyltransferase [Actinomycetospora chiangmaiensis]|uniref:MGDG synthase family glycosyltransferase n=1 Tax=Actinomycetospora chiangmaiensis TaxID=402650 RepID=UPI0012FBE173|nr:hypothetical protein [Actinomycetospora chiangmaiensis]